MNLPALLLIGAAAAAVGLSHPELSVRLAEDARPAPEVVKYSIDPAHSSVMFRIKRDVAFFFGRFDRIEGEIELDKEDIENSTIEIRIAAESVYTANERRDNHLRSPDFFDVKQFPTITFKSTKITQAEDDIFDLEGELEIHGVKKKVQVSVVKTGEQDRRGSRIGYELTLELKRSEFEMNYGRGGLSDEVTLMIGIAAQTGGGRRRRGRD